MVILGSGRTLFGSVRMLFGGFEAGHGEGKSIFASESILKWYLYNYSRKHSLPNKV